ncbi:hypothetical protein EGR_01076 [Echinococcus granulosus]|uniref:Uncharacterized protein n=1 Tax=Echinococcus granulosus TaxID=6210 RepID=W6URV5_ECHGR|nr:hypothetical protein EGR_01076 [Echinococcus granulosus]EUB63948.1 hypothetical protein EGR_01076 [Echinococcus granulosus]
MSRPVGGVHATVSHATGRAGDAAAAAVASCAMLLSRVSCRGVGGSAGDGNATPQQLQLSPSRMRLMGP